MEAVGSGHFLLRVNFFQYVNLAHSMYGFYAIHGMGVTLVIDGSWRFSDSLLKLKLAVSRPSCPASMTQFKEVHSRPRKARASAALRKRALGFNPPIAAYTILIIDW
ncbi:hypothetical protein ACLOJK_002943 [Asimina triloba]